MASPSSDSFYKMPVEVGEAEENLSFVVAPCRWLLGDHGYAVFFHGNFIWHYYKPQEVDSGNMELAYG